jgi:hypothetical protein
VAERNRDVVWCDHLAIGFVAVHVTREAVEASFVSVTDPRVARSPTPVQRRVRVLAEDRGVSAWTQL